MKNAIETLNHYRNCHYADPSGTESHELANAINKVLPLMSDALDRMDKDPVASERNKDNPKSMGKYRGMPWPQNIWSAALRVPVSAEELPKNWEAILDHVLSTLGNDRRKQLLLFYFRDGASFQDIARSVNEPDGSVIIKQLAWAIEKLRHPSRQFCLMYGPPTKSATHAFLSYDTPIAALGLSPRAYNCLRRIGVSSVGELCTRDKESISAARGCGALIVREIEDALAAHGLSLRKQYTNQ